MPTSRVSPILQWTLACHVGVRGLGKSPLLREGESHHGPPLMAQVFSGPGHAGCCPQGGELPLPWPQQGPPCRLGRAGSLDSVASLASHKPVPGCFAFQAPVVVTLVCFREIIPACKIDSLGATAAHWEGLLFLG